VFDDFATHDNIKVRLMEVVSTATYVDQAKLSVPVECGHEHEQVGVVQRLVGRERRSSKGRLLAHSTMLDGLVSNTRSSPMEGFVFRRRREISAEHGMERE
jgi:hypothetical protein